MATDFTLVAQALIDDELGQSGVSRIPAEVYTYCVAQVAKRLGEIESLDKGLVQYGADGETTFMSSDPKAPVAAILKKYKGLGARA